MSITFYSKSCFSSPDHFLLTRIEHAKLSRNQTTLIFFFWGGLPILKAFCCVSICISYCVLTKHVIWPRDKSQHTNDFKRKEEEDRGCMQTGKSGKIISKLPKVWKVRESQGIWKKCSAWSGKVRENFFSKYLVRFRK